MLKGLPKSSKSSKLANLTHDARLSSFQSQLTAPFTSLNKSLDKPLKSPKRARFKPRKTKTDRNKPLVKFYMQKHNVHDIDPERA